LAREPELPIEQRRDLRLPGVDLLLLSERSGAL
jgi:hypothetical protein